MTICFDYGKWSIWNKSKYHVKECHIYPRCMLNLANCWRSHWWLSRATPQSNRVNFKSLCKFLLAHSNLACHCESVLSLPFKCGKTHTTVSQPHLKVIRPIQRCVIPSKCGKIHKASTVTMKIIGNKRGMEFSSLL